MEISLEVLLTFILTPVLTATGTLFTLYVRTKDAQLKDRDGVVADQRERIRTYENEVLPALKANVEINSKMADLYERMQTRHEWEMQMLRKELGEK